MVVKSSSTGGEAGRAAPPPGETGPAPGAGSRTTALGPALRRAWVGHRQRLDRAMAAAGFVGSGLPDGRVLRLCARSDAVTASQIGRELGITRQGAGKVVANLRGKGYVTLRTSEGDRREKVVSLTQRGRDYLAAHRSASRQLERELEATIGTEAFEQLLSLLDVLGGDDPPRMRDYLRLAFADDDARRA